MKKISKISVLIIIIISILQFSIVSFATQVLTPIIQETEEKHLIYQGNMMNKNKMLILNGEPIYKLSSESEEDVNYTTDSFGELKDETIINIIKFGYPNYNKEALNCNTDFEAYTATQEAIYTVFDSRVMEAYTIKDEIGQRIYDAMQQILENAKNSQFQNELNVEFNEINQQLLEEDESYMQKEYIISLNRPITTGKLIIENGDGIKLSKTEIYGEESFKILIPKDRLQQNISIKLITNMIENFNIKIAYDSKPSFGRNKQQIHLNPEYIQKEYNLNLQTEQPSILKITNIDKNTKQPIQGNKFELLNSELVSVKSDLVTNEKGEIIIPTLENGKYYLKQTEAIGEYCVNKSNLSIEVTGTESVINVKIVSCVEERESIETLEKEINLNEYNKNIERVNNKEITNYNTTNTFKDITNNTTIKEKENNNIFTNTTNNTSIEKTIRDRIYNNLIMNKNSTTSVNKNSKELQMTKEDFINLMQLVSSDLSMERLPEAGI